MSIKITPLKPFLRQTPSPERGAEAWSCRHFDVYGDTFEFGLMRRGIDLIHSAGIITDGGAAITEDAWHNYSLCSSFAEFRREVVFAVVETEQNSSWNWAQSHLTVQQVVNRLMDCDNYPALVGCVIALAAPCLDTYMDADLAMRHA